MNNRFVRIACLIALLTGLGAQPASAETTMRVGAVNAQKGYAVIDDRVFLIAAGTRVTRANGATGMLTDLRTGTYVTIQTTATPGSSKPTLVEIRIVR